MSQAFATKYWTWWVILAFLTFIIPEVYSLVKKRPEGTLSGYVWRFEKFDPAHGLTVWTAGHLLFTGIFIVLCVWLIGHFGWRYWT